MSLKDKCTNSAPSVAIEIHHGVRRNITFPILGVPISPLYVMDIQCNNLANTLR